jgi:subtilisin family serine protease
METTSDGSYVVETGMSDEELLSYGQVVVYRFKSVPNMVAVKSFNLGNQSHNFKYNTEIYNLPFQNLKNRLDVPYSKKFSNPSPNCFSAYCEANFDKVISDIKSRNLFLNKVKIAVVDSGIIPATFQIKKNLISSINISGDQNLDNWSTHATYIASIFSGVTRNNKVTDIYAENAELYSFKVTFFGDSGEINKKRYGSMQLAAALDEAVYSGAKIVNLSLSYIQEPDQNVEIAEKIVISNASKKGILFVVAAGNDGNNLKNTPAFPASYYLNNMITVASHNSNLVKADSSNYGSSVDLSAQGVLIELNNKNGGVDSVGGTSFSAPIVASALSLYYGLFPNADMNIVLKYLFSSANLGYNSLSAIHDDKVSKYGRLDVKAFIDMGTLDENIVMNLSNQ